MPLNVSDKGSGSLETDPVVPVVKRFVFVASGNYTSFCRRVSYSSSFTTPPIFTKSSMATPFWT